MDDHLGYGKHDPLGRYGSKSRSGKRRQSVLTKAGPVELEVPRDRDSSREWTVTTKACTDKHSGDKRKTWRSRTGASCARGSVPGRDRAHRPG